MLACIHSIRHLLSITRSQERTNHVSPLPFITIIHPSTMHCTVPLSMAFVHARITLSWLAHNGMQSLHAHRLPTTTLQRDIYTYMHACTEMRTTRMMMMMMVMPSSSHPLNLLMSIFGGGDRGGDGGGGSIDCRVDVDAAASLMLRVDS